MFDWLYQIFGTILAFFNDITGHYALALVLYALVFKIVFLPFSLKTQKNQIAMAKLRPKMAKILPSSPTSRTRMSVRGTFTTSVSNS